MGFAVSAEAYDRFMGRYASPLASSFADLAGVVAGQVVLDVGCGPGTLTTELVERVGQAHVVAVDPSATFVGAAAARHPGVGVVRAVAERLPLADQAVDVALAQLVVHFMGDPVAGLRSMARATRPGGTVAACVWDHHDGGSPLSLFWDLARTVDPAAPGQADHPGTRRGHLGTLMTQAGLADVHSGSLSVEVVHPTAADWWAPFELGVGPAGAYVAGLDPAARDRLRRICLARIGERPFTVTGVAWTAIGRRPE